MPLDLQFCEQCEVYHHQTLVEGRLGFADCERRIDERFSSEVLTPKKLNRVAYRQATPLSHSDSPSSNPSFTSIHYHLTPPQHKQSRFNPSIPSHPSPPIHPGHPLPPNQSPQAFAKRNNPQPQMIPQHLKPNIQPAIHIAQRKQANQLSLQPKAVQITPQVSVVSTLRVPDQRQKSLLSTIQEEKWDCSQLSKSLYSANKSGGVSQRSSFEGGLLLGTTGSQRLNLVEKFEEMRKDGDEVVSREPSYKFKSLRRRYGIGEEPQEDEKVCWCW